MIASPSMRERLQRYAALRMENENRLERLARLKADAELPAQREADGSAHTGSSGDRMARAAERYMAYEDEVRPLIAANEREMADVRAAVDALGDPCEREVLRIRYLDAESFRPAPWWKVALAMYGGAERRHVDAALRVHRRAMEQLEKMRINDNV